MEPWGRDQIESQLKHFPEGQIVVECDGRVVANSSSLMLDYEDELEWCNWKKISDAGYIRNHQPTGDTLYGIEIMVDPDYRGCSRFSYFPSFRQCDREKRQCDQLERSSNGFVRGSLAERAVAC